MTESKTTAVALLAVAASAFGYLSWKKRKDGAEKRKAAKAALTAPIPPASNFPPLKNDLILRAARKQKTERVPIWLHRQAGRYLPEFREERKNTDFFTMCRTPELACRVTMQPIKRFPLDAAIIFSDILVVPQAMGLEVKMVAEEGPVFPERLVDPSHMSRLKTVKEVDAKNSLKYVYDAITLTRHRLGGQVPLIGFCGGPWTCMAYMIEGGSSKTWERAKTWLYQHPKASHELLQRLTDVSVEYLTHQALAGAQMLQVFESSAGELSPAAFAEYALPYLEQINKRVRANLRELKVDEVPMSVFPRGATASLDAICGAGYHVISLDHNIDPAVARQVVKGRATLQGNLDPIILKGSPERMANEARRMVEAFGTQAYICNLGHGMLPSHEPRAVGELVQVVHEHSEALNKKS